MKSLMTFNIPSTLHKGIIHIQEEEDTKIPHSLQNRYMSGVGFLIYIVKHSRLELFNAVREVSKCMTEENMIQYKALIREIKYFIYTKDFLYYMKPDRNINGPLKLRGYSDVEYSGNNDIRKRVKHFSN